MTVTTSTSAKNYKFVGTITTVQPVSISLPKTIGMPINTHGSAYIHAASIRGFLRSIAHQAVVLELEKMGKKLTVDQHYMLGSGVDTARVVKLGGGYEAVNKNLPIRTKNPLISLFGNFVVGSHFQIGNALASPNENPLVVLGNGSRSHVFTRNKNLVNSIDENELEYLQNVMSATADTAEQTGNIEDQISKLKKQLSKADPEAKAAIFTQMAKLDEEMKEVKASRTGSPESIQRILRGFEAIDAGYTLSHRLQITDVTGDELEFFLWVLYKAGYDFRIGGHLNLGCGQVHAEWDVSVSSLDEPKPTKLGKVLINDDGLEIIPNNDVSNNKLVFDPSKVEEKIRNGTFDFTVY
ncbi:RAMP superfamily CRISPR-associated protein [Acinetobacter baumannii]